MSVLQQAISPNFNEVAGALGRSTEGFAIIDFVDTSRFKIASVEASSVERPVTSQIAQGYMVAHKYNSLGIPTELEDKFYGWRSEVFSDKYGLLLSEQTLTIAYENTVSSSNFWWVADDLYHPVDFVVSILSGEEWTDIANVTGHASGTWFTNLPEYHSFTAIKITITRVSPVGATVNLLSFGPVTRMTMNSSALRDFEVLEDLAIDDSNATGQINSNLLSLLIDDRYGWFASASTASPFMSMVEPNLKVKVYTGLFVDDDTIEYIPLGTFYTTEWKPSSSSLQVSFTAYDRLRSIMEAPTPMYPVIQDATIQDMIRKLFILLGLVEGIDFEIEPTVNAPIKAGWFPGNTVGEVLDVFAEAGNLQINVNRYDKIIVKNFGLDTTPALVLTDTDLLLDTANPQIFRNVFTSVDVNYYTPIVGEVQEVWGLEEVTLSAGESITYSNIEFRAGPVTEIAYVDIKNSLQVSVTSLVSGSNSATFTIKNTSNSAVTISVRVLGYILQLTPEKVNVEKDSMWGNKVYTVENQLIQNSSYASSYANRVLNFLGDNHREMNANWRVNPLVNIGDTVEIINPSDKVLPTLARVSSLTTRYAGSLEGSLRVHKSIL